MTGYPPPPGWASALRSVGVTGTNGKTSTTTYLAAALAELATPVAWVTTVGSGVGDPRHDLGQPPPADHGRFLLMMDQLRSRGGRWAAIEVTSASLGLGFARAWPCAIAVFTNLGHDHMRTHGTVEHYLASKAQLFVHLPPGGIAVLNAGDPNAELLAEIVPAHASILWFAGPDRALDRVVDVRVRRADPDWSGLAVELEVAAWIDPPEPVRLANPATVQAENYAAALLAAIAAGVPSRLAARAIARCPAPRGRFESIVTDGKPRVVVDYAHDPEALRRLLADARRLITGSLVLVFGAGGDTDVNKRLPMGAAAGLADRVWLTSDNPRHEDPAIIAAALRAGVPADIPCVVELDRSRAIARAIAEARPEDLVVISGKGHETVQVIGSESRPCSDHEIATRCLAREPAR
jgi:UDP-N-acetylmuramoyl-L-alanyl-D-glutamate--2,6-diaminopimelate ligase